MIVNITENVFYAVFVYIESHIKYTLYIQQYTIYIIWKLFVYICVVELHPQI